MFPGFSGAFSRSNPMGFDPIVLLTVLHRLFSRGQGPSRTMFPTLEQPPFQRPTPVPQMPWWGQEVSAPFVSAPPQDPWQSMFAEQDYGSPR